MFAVASFSRQISISCEPDDFAFCVLEGQRGGVTHLTFSPDGNRLFSGGRRVSYFRFRSEIVSLTNIILLLFVCMFMIMSSCSTQDPEILCWDVRNLGSVLSVMKRHADTNQRMFFDIDPAGDYLMTGNTDGSICAWLIRGSERRSAEDQMPDGSGDRDCISSKDGDSGPVLTFQAHGDSANGVRYEKVCAQPPPPHPLTHSVCLCTRCC